MAVLVLMAASQGEAAGNHYGWCIGVGNPHRTANCDHAATGTGTGGSTTTQPSTVTPSTGTTTTLGPTQPAMQTPVLAPTLQPQQVPQRVPQRVPQPIPQRVPPKKSNTGGGYHQVPPTQNVAVPTPLPQRTPQIVPPTINVPPHKVTAVPKPLPQRQPVLVPPLAPQRVPGRVPTAQPSAIPVLVPPLVPQRVPNRVPNQVPTATPGAIPGAIPILRPQPTVPIRPVKGPATVSLTTVPGTQVVTGGPGTSVRPPLRPGGSRTLTNNGHTIGTVVPMHTPAKPGRQPEHRRPIFETTKSHRYSECISAGYGARRLDQATGTIRHAGEIDSFARDVPARHPNRAHCLVQIHHRKRR
ncbi:hypothetical protein R5H30_00255 [Sulfitobacter sp. D35]|uniref:hypothetical protein n=1 Tax=Sulfitobacter sp. D35 TaxID=3083252 RepID=UPI00296EE4EA|nr:hypothetical protein [Sulfitobacter sp. D35]MDW4496396.1 hypothetical protein [Sulfitobacter sp. D35]